ncbi:endonuclease/exonuclease/phosphatase family protein [Sabulicella glaciei]|uniref:Endonuclease/exonuclease/phosphatase family protein n=1 Tax=Sabulicella glaciei TaxID=2984948 RepID=A0ABT3NTF2_9PROT|nr:endonuclease/exonuclease/phosphatase family protein [Roseococcus sp. MDT2-1-1]MCW8085440.1 endonuclease/exonuclease/phosphatase family protein [Roseococcus sp. MDT2-1-1]
MSLLTIASYNVHKCVGTDRRFNPGRVTEVIAELGADLLALQEVDRRFGRRIGLLDMMELERRTGLRHIPLSMIPQGQGWHGNALLFREGEVTSIRRLSLPGGEPRGAAAVDLRLRGVRLRVVATHFGLLKQHRLQQCGAILELLAQEDLPTLILGDLNEWRVGRRSSLLPLHQSFQCSQFSPATFPSRLPLLPLDRILGWPRGLVRELEAHDSALARVASDHLPLKAQLDLEAAAAHGGTGLVPRAA